MKQLKEYLIKNNIYLTSDVEGVFAEIFKNYQSQEVAIVGMNLAGECEKLRKLYRLSFIETPPELCYSLAGVNLSRIQIKENVRLLVAYGDEHALNLTKLLANKLDVPFVCVTRGYVSVYTQCKYAVIDGAPVFVKPRLLATIVDERAEFCTANAFCQTMSHLFGCFENYLNEKFFETPSTLNTKIVFDTYFELLNTNGKFEGEKDRQYLLKLNLLLAVQYGLFSGNPFCDSYYLALEYLSHNVRQFADFAKINFVFAQMLAVLYEIYFKNELQSPLYVVRDDLEKSVTLGKYAQALSKTPAQKNAKLNYIYKVYTALLQKMSESFQRLYDKTSFYAKNLMPDAGFALFSKLSCETLIETIKNCSLFNANTLLYKFGLTEVLP